MPARSTGSAKGPATTAKASVGRLTAPASPFLDLWWSRLTLVLVIVALLALLIIPIVAGARMETLRRQIADRLMPALEYIEDVELAVALTVSALRGYLVSGDDQLLDEFWQAQQSQESLADELRRLVADFQDGELIRLVDELDVAQQRYMEVALALAEGRIQPEQYVQIVPAQQTRVRAVLAAAHRLSDGVRQTQNSLAMEIGRTSARANRLVLVAAIFGLGSTLAVAALGRRTAVLARRLERRAAQESALRRIAGDLAQATRLPDLLGRVARDAREAAGADGAYVEQVFFDTNEVRIVAVDGVGTPPPGLCLPFPGSLAEEVIGRRRPEFLDNLAIETRPIGRHLMESCGNCHGLVVPLLSEKEAVGALVLLRRQDQPLFTEPEASHVQIMADMSALALRRVLVMEELQAGRERLEANAREREKREELAQFLAEASRILGASLDVEDTLRQLARLALPRVADWCTVDLLEGGRLHRLAVEHTDPARVDAAHELRRRYPPDLASDQPLARAVRTGESQLIHGFTEQQLREYARDDEHYRLLTEVGLQSLLVTPMKAHGEVLGLIVLASSDIRRPITAADVPIAEQLAGRAALAVSNARLYREAEQARGEAERRAREEAALREAASAVSASFSVREVVRQIAASAVEATNADGAFLERIDFPRRELVLAATAGQVPLTVGMRRPYDGSLAQQVLERNQAHLIDRVSDATSLLPEPLVRECADCSAVVIPMVDAGEEIGALVLVRSADKWHFREDEVQRAFTFGNLASLAFRKVHLLEESERHRRELVEVMESRANLVRGFSHDVKNPLGAADGFLQLLAEGVLGELQPSQEEALGRVRRSIRAALQLIDDVLELARAEAREIDLHLAAIDVREAVTEMVGEYRASAAARKLELDLELPPELPLIQSDVRRIRQILSNLLSNALKYTASGKIVVRVESRENGSAPASGRWVAVEVIDTGPGIPTSKQHLLFQEFTRIQPSAESGAGLGLAISKRLALALGGNITVESDEGRGSTFTVWLPVQRIH